MKLDLWTRIIALRGDIATLLERTLFNSGGGPLAERGLLPLVEQETLGRLRAELRTKLDELKDSLVKEFSDKEVYLVMFPLVLLCDEMVMSRLPKQQQTMWFLLQSELFQINYGGDVFYDFVDERVSKPDTPTIVFEILYYCLSAGFVGKLGVDAGKVPRYRALLAERIPGAVPPVRKKRRRREAKESPEPLPAAPPPAAEPGARVHSPFWYYATTLGVIMLAVGGMFVLSNL